MKRGTLLPNSTFEKEEEEDHARKAWRNEPQNVKDLYTYILHQLFFKVY